MGRFSEIIDEFFEKGEEYMRKEEIKKQLWTIPNIITYFRLFCIPFFIWCTVDRATYISWGDYSFPIIGMIIMVVAATSDLFDGMIARKFNQATAIGAALDPIADKLMHISALLSLTIIGFVHWGFVIALILKELLMIIGGIFLVKYSQPIKANYVGKVASALLSFGVFMSFFHEFFRDKAFYSDWIVIGISLIITYVAFAGYLKQAIPVFTIVLKALKEGKDPNDVFEARAKEMSKASQKDETDKSTNNNYTVSQEKEDKMMENENTLDN
jgi:cardiolipin synthase (CMP-forming)